MDEWTRRLFTIDEKRAWIAAGLGEDDASLAERCLAAGLSPDDLQLRVDGVRAVVRLRGGDSFASVRLRIEETKRRRQSDAG